MGMLPLSTAYLYSRPTGLQRHHSQRIPFFKSNRSKGKGLSLIIHSRSLRPARIKIRCLGKTREVEGYEGTSVWMVSQPESSGRAEGLSRHTHIQGNSTNATGFGTSARGEGFDPFTRWEVEKPDGDGASAGREIRTGLDRSTFRAVPGGEDGNRGTKTSEMASGFDAETFVYSVIMTDLPVISVAKRHGYDFADRFSGVRQGERLVSIGFLGDTVLSWAIGCEGFGQTKAWRFERSSLCRWIYTARVSQRLM